MSPSLARNGPRPGALGTRGPVRALVIVVLAALALLLAARVVGARRHLLLARSELQAARQALSHRDEAGAEVSLQRAAHHLVGARASTWAFPLGLLRRVPLVGSPGRALASAASAGLDVVAAGRVLAAASASFPTSASAAVDGQDLSAFHAAAARSRAAVGEADRRLRTAATALAGPAGAALPPVSGPAGAMRAEVDRGRRELAGVARGLTLLEDLTGTGADARLLLLSQDSLELRPTGGYIGSYGVLWFSHGTVRLEKYEATEDLPAPVPPATPPDGLAGYLPSYWGLSNANWWPNFPTTASTATELFRTEGGGEVDGVLALTEAATARLVGALGSLRLPGYAKPVTEAGFDQRVVYEVELKQPPDAPRKKFLVELSNALFDSLFHLPADKLPGVGDAVKQSLGAGDIQLWFKDSARQDQLLGTQVAGELPRTDDDFLMLVDADMAAGKANLEVTKQVDYSVRRDKLGRLVGHVRVEVRNDGVKSAINPLYNGFLRVYAPQGSRLLTQRDLQVEVPADDGPFEVFSQAVIVQPKGQAVVTFDYLLPERVGAAGRYRLTWIRQVGTRRDRLRLEVFGRRAEVDPGGRSLKFQRDLTGSGPVQWLRRRWIVHQLGL